MAFAFFQIVVLDTLNAGLIGTFGAVTRLWGTAALFLLSEKKPLKTCLALEIVRNSQCIVCNSQGINSTIKIYR
jgi:hypothetical protein